MEKVLAKSLRLMFSGSAVVAGLGLAAQAAHAQDSAAPLQRVEITGSAIKRIDAESSVPVTVLKADDLKKQGFTTIEEVMNTLSVSQATQGTSQSIGSGTGGASFADLRGIGANKTLVLLNGRRLSNNAFDSSAPDLNMIPFAALERVEVLRDGASALYGSDAVGGVINFITKKNFQGGAATFGEDSPQHAGGKSLNANFAYGFGDLDKDRYNVTAVLDHQEQQALTGTQRPWNTRYNGGVSSSTAPANYYQNGKSFNPAAPDCTSAPNLFAKSGTCYMTTSPFVDYIPRNQRDSALIKGTFKLSNDHELGLEYLNSQSVVSGTIAPVPYGGLYQNRTRADGTPNPYYPSNAALDPTYTESSMPAGVQPGFVHMKWRDLPNGSRQDKNTNNQQRFVASLEGNLGGWDYNTAFTWNENKVRQDLMNYSDGNIISAGILNGVINPFGAQDAAGTALLNSAALSGTVMNAKGTTTGLDFHASREVGDWLGAGRAAALAVGAQASYEQFMSAANTDFAQKVVASTGIDPNSYNAGSRHVYAGYAELNVPIIKSLDVTASVRYDRYSDFGGSTNPKLAFRFQPTNTVLLRGSVSSGFRAPSLYEINAAQTYTNSAGTYSDPVNCPTGVTAINGKASAANCNQQFMVLNGGNANLSPETSRNASLGLMVEPIKDLSVGVDLWAIQLKHSIGSLSSDSVFGDPALYASVYHRNPAGDLSVDGTQCPNPATCGYIDLRTQNLGGINTNGVDLSANYRLRTTAYGNYTLNSNSTYVHKYEYQTAAGSAWNQNVGVFSGSGPIFRWQNTTNLVWNKGELSAGLTAHYKSGYQDQLNSIDPTNRVGSYTTFDTYVAWAQRKGFGLTAGVRNLADRAPPLSYQTVAFQAGYDPRFYDSLGRTFYVRGTYSF